MSIKKLLFGLMLGAFSFNYSYGQASLLNAKKVNTIGKKTTEQIAADNDGPLAYGFIDDRDIVWSKVVWEVIDFNQKINFPYYYPIDTTSIESSRLSLYNTLQKALKKNKFKTYEDSYFTSEKTLADINENLNANCVNLGYPMSVTAQDIKSFKIKGMYYFDKRQGEMKYRLLAIAPLVEIDAKTKCSIEEARENANQAGVKFEMPEAEEPIALYWVFYPEIRQVMYDAKVFNPNNSSQPISYDHLLNARRFSSTIVREENLYGNRKISDYVRGNSLFQLLEADRIKENIRNREMDMWNY
ncbi:MAG: gliding motility protein GldN [Flavobacteriaceae bacterium]